jgi:hypothetical protein
VEFSKLNKKNYSEGFIDFAQDFNKKNSELALMALLYCVVMRSFRENENERKCGKYFNKFIAKQFVRI